MAMQVDKGDKLPSVSLKDQDGKSVNLSKFKGKPLVLYFYPADDSPGCTKQVLESYIPFWKTVFFWSLCRIPGELHVRIVKHSPLNAC